MDKLPEGKGDLERTIESLREVAARFRALGSEAEIAMAQQNAADSNAKLRERAEMIVALPSRLQEVLAGLDNFNRTKIAMRLNAFAALAKRSLDENNYFGLGVLLSIRGDTQGDKNLLEKLIEELESQH